MKTFISLLIFSFFCFSSVAHSRIVLPADTIPFEIGPDHRMYVQSFINGDKKKSFRFLVDTGASDIVLNASIAEVMGKADFSESIINHGATSVETIPSTKPIQKLQIGNSEVIGLRFIAITYPPEAWDGVLGLAFLTNYDVIINNERKEIYLYDKGNAPLPNEGSLDFEYKLGVPIIPVQVTINGKQYPIEVEVDTGSDRILDINTPYVETHQLRGTLHVFAISRISGTNSVEGILENVCFDRVKIGSTVFPLLPGAFSTLKTGVQATKEFDGVIGNNLLQRFNQQWDFKNKKLYLTVNNRYYTPFYDFLNGN